MTQPLPPLNTLGYVLADPATGLPLIERGRVMVFSSDAAAKAYRARYARATEALTAYGPTIARSRVLAVAMIPLMSGVPADQAAVVTDVDVGTHFLPAGATARRRRIKGGDEE